MQVEDREPAIGLVTVRDRKIDRNRAIRRDGGASKRSKLISGIAGKLRAEHRRRIEDGRRPQHREGSVRT